jgi:hypothetical protein
MKLPVNCIKKIANNPTKMVKSNFEHSVLLTIDRIFRICCLDC